MNVSVYSILITRRQKANGKFPVKIRIGFLRKFKDFGIGLDLTQEEYLEAKKERPKKEHREIAIKLQTSLQKAQRIVNKLDIFSFPKFEAAFYGRIKEASDINPFFDEYIDSLKKEERIKTAVSYTTAKNSLINYKSKIGFYDITKEFLKDYHNFQIKKGISETTIGIYVRSLRTIFNYAINLGVIKKDVAYPFGRRQYVIPSGRNIKKALTPTQIKLIYNYDAAFRSPEDKARDFFIFSFLCNGVNFKDICLLRNRDIDGSMLRFIRSKTKKTTIGNQSIISCYLSPHTQEIISKWGSGNTGPEELLFPIINVDDTVQEQYKKIEQFIKTTNKYLKVISNNCKFERSITTYFSRHSAATFLKHSGASIQQIQEALGHQNSSTTQKYLDSFDDESKQELSNSLTSFL